GGGEAGALLLALLAVAAVAAGYAAYIYNLPKAVAGHTSSTTAVSIVLGTQHPQPWRHVFLELTPAIVCLGLFGFVVLLTGLRHLTRPPQVLAAGTVAVLSPLPCGGRRASLARTPPPCVRVVSS